MSIKEIIFSIFYAGCFITAIAGGIITGFKGNSHTPPLPFLVELIALPVGFLFCFIDIIVSRPATARKMRVHIGGLILNGLVMFEVIWMALNGH